MKKAIIRRYGIVFGILFGLVFITNAFGLPLESSYAPAQIITPKPITPFTPIPLPENLPESPYPLIGWEEAPSTRTITLNEGETWGILCLGLKKNDRFLTEVTVHNDSFRVDVIETAWIQEGYIWDDKWGRIARYNMRDVQPQITNSTVPQSGNWLILFRSTPSYSVSFSYKFYTSSPQETTAPTNNLLYSYYIFFALFLVTMWFINKKTNPQWSFQFFIHNNRSQDATTAMNQVIHLKSLAKPNKQKELIPPFKFSTFWSKGSIILLAQNEYISVSGIVERSMRWYHWVLVCLPFIVIYGITYTSLLLLIIIPIGMFLDFIIGRKKRQALGSQLNKVTHGTQFTQKLSER